MNPFDIFVAYISWKTGGKRRPVLIISTGDSNEQTASGGATAPGVYGFGITTQYENKVVRIAKPIGRLTQEDMELLIAFLEK